ncbi:TonB-dependent receptor domain-containing protein [Luteimonas aquatica]|uniref:TonB-dependent receptor domain-containing protein n=1 Tax=Luteimonas aquatica TaxID=450364 RepID=UPI001F589A41|nr:TonB-dependent receptor [Luteimonas aquatica]
MVFRVPPGELATGLEAYLRQSGKQVIYRMADVRGLRTQGIAGTYSPEQALAVLLRGTRLTAEQDASGAIALVPMAATRLPAVTAAKPRSESGVAAPGSHAGPVTLDTMLVTAGKRVERIQDVPMAMSVLDAQALEAYKIEGGPELVRAVPNTSFTKTNFATHNFQIRGIGTQTLSVNADPAVGIGFNGAPIISSRLYELEYFDLDRVEVLRGPQGTLQGRNATAGAINMVPNIASPDGFEASVMGEVGNYDTARINGMVNAPLGDRLALRVAMQHTQRGGYDYNEVTGKHVNDRDLLGVRASLAWKPSEKIAADLTWDHFQEDDNRSRTGKQLCHRDPKLSMVGNQPVRPIDHGYLNQGCKDGSLYDRDAFDAPNAAGFPFVLAAQSIGGYVGDYPDTGRLAFLISPGTDPYAGVRQSRDLRRIATSYDPKFQAVNDVGQLNLEADVGEGLRLSSQTTYTRDSYYSTQDYGRFQSNPIFTDTNLLVDMIPGHAPGLVYPFAPGGVYCDPQLGCSNRLLQADLVDSGARQWSQEFRLQSSFGGPFDFKVGANFLDYGIDENYYIFNNIFTAMAQGMFNRHAATSTPVDCLPVTAVLEKPNANGDYAPCVYIDPNPLRSISGQGHNYFRNRNLAAMHSTAIFGEGYWRLSDSARMTAGLRLTRDVKVATPVPSQLLLAKGLFGGGYAGYGYPESPRIRQAWQEPTGRLVLDWSPDLAFSDSTLFYGSLARGYKAGGANAPGIGANPAYLSFTQRDPRFKAESVVTFEAGMKNVMADGKLVLNATMFYNDYSDYQVSQLYDRATFNENFDAKTWGVEIEALWKPTSRFQVGGNLGLLRTRIDANQYSIDVMDRTAGNSGWMVVRPWLQLASNCIAPRALVETALRNFYAVYPDDTLALLLNSFCTVNTLFSLGGFTRDGGNNGGPGDDAPFLGGLYYNPLVDAPNQGAGFAKNVGGNELPNAPRLTVNLSPQYTFALKGGDLTLRADLYYQSKSWARIYQDRIDRLHDWGNVNVSLTWYQPRSDLTVQLYVKNALDGEAITGTYLNGDDNGLTANVFLQDPRIIGLALRKGFD